MAPIFYAHRCEIVTPSIVYRLGNCTIAFPVDVRETTKEDASKPRKPRICDRSQDWKRSAGLFRTRVCVMTASARDRGQWAGRYRQRRREKRHARRAI